MSLQTRINDFITAVGTDYKGLRTFLTGSSAGALSGLTTTAQDVKGAINELKASSGSPAAASEAASGVAELATQTETNTGTDDLRIVTPLKFHTRLLAYAQPLSANLTSLAGAASSSWGRARLNDADASATKTALGLSAVATSGSAADLTGTLPSSVLPPLAINETFVVASQAAMLALTAQRGDVAKRTDNSNTYILSTDNPGTLEDWIEVTATGDIVSVNGQTGTVVVTKSDVGLANVDNTSDANKPVSTAQSTANDLRLLKTANLSDLQSASAARSNLSVYSQSELGNPETDLVALYTAAKA